ncbi:MAG TPA: hypothetical protein DEO71_18665 [Chryseobacterium sp.]|nr:hypothetical protein [Chryseobacterium sp.]
MNVWLYLKGWKRNTFERKSKVRKLRVLEISKNEISAKLVDPIRFTFSNAKMESISLILMKEMV